MRIKAAIELDPKNAPMNEALALPVSVPVRRRIDHVACTIELDARGLEPPEPLVRVLAALDSLHTGDSLLLKIDCRPLPLYRILDRNGYVYEERQGSDSLFGITIRLRGSA